MSQFSRRSLMKVGAIALASQFINPRPSYARDRVVNLYSSRHYDTDERLYKDFTQKTGIEINVLKGKADELITRIQNEGRNSPADILITVDAARLWRAETAGIFAPIASELLASRIPKNLRHPEGLWFSLTKRARVIMYNRDRVSPAKLSTYEDLASSQWNGKLAIRSSDNVYNQSLVASLIFHLGEAATEQWCRGIVANMARPPQGADMDQIKAAAAGQAELALANTYYFTRFAPGRKAANSAVFDRIGVYFPNQNGRGAHVNVSGAGIINTAPNREAAIRFLEYLLSPAAQEIFAKGNSEYPVIAGVPLDPVVADFGKFKEDTLNVAALGRNNPAAVRIMNRAGWR